MYLTSGYPWGSIRARDTFMALPGCTLAIDHLDDYHAIMGTILKALNNYIDNEMLDERIHGIDLPDIPLWCIWAIQRYARYQGIEAARKEYLPEVARILDWIIAGGHPNLAVETNGLVGTTGTNTPVSWMNATSNGWPLIPRTGLLVEFNALWFNALMFASALAADVPGYEKRRDEWTTLADEAKPAFIDTFLNEHGYLYDYVQRHIRRPVGTPEYGCGHRTRLLPARPSPAQGCARRRDPRAADSKGLRTLSPKSYGYRPFYVGSPQGANRPTTTAQPAHGS